MIILFQGEYLVAVFAIVFAGKGDKIGFGIGLHSEVGTGGNLERDFHVVILEFLLSEVSL